MSRDLGRDIPDVENFTQENFGLIFRTLDKGVHDKAAAVRRQVMRSATGAAIPNRGKQGFPFRERGKL